MSMVWQWNVNWIGGKKRSDNSDQNVLEISGMVQWLRKREESGFYKHMPKMCFKKKQKTKKKNNTHIPESTKSTNCNTARVPSRHNLPEKL